MRPARSSSPSTPLESGALEQTIIDDSNIVSATMRDNANLPRPNGLLRAGKMAFTIDIAVPLP
jgi:hypothetical protein